MSWARSVFDALRPRREDAVNVNNLGSESRERVRSAYRPNHAALMRAYEPAKVPPQPDVPRV